LHEITEKYFQLPGGQRRAAFGGNNAAKELPIHEITEKILSITRGTAKGCCWREQCRERIIGTRNYTEKYF
jgi:hypothetical protein